MIYPLRVKRERETMGGAAERDRDKRYNEKRE